MTLPQVRIQERPATAHKLLNIIIQPIPLFAPWHVNELID